LSVDVVGSELSLLSGKSGVKHVLGGGGLGIESGREVFSEDIDLGLEVVGNPLGVWLVSVCVAVSISLWVV
jgi:hypothetical protein